MIVTSSLLRTIQTAVILFGDDKELTVTDLCREFNSGVNCNCRHDLEYIYEKISNPISKHSIKFEDSIGIESSQEPQSYYDRVTRFYEFLKSLGKEKIMVISHENFTRDFMRMYAKKKPIGLDNCETVVVTIE